VSNPGSAVPVWHDRGNPSERVYMQGVRSGVPLPHSGVVDLTSAEHFPRHRTYRAASGAIDGATGHTFTAVRPWTTNLNGNTATRRLSIQEAQPHEGSIDNEMRERRLMKQMRQVAAKIGELLVKEIARAARGIGLKLNVHVASAMDLPQKACALPRSQHACLTWLKQAWPR